ncbi:MAG: 4a-hydroxytetrahydrobiopterin dehydratase [Pseudomonadota bacterium]
MDKLAEKSCVPCEGGVDPLARDAAEALMAQIDDGWQLVDKATRIRRDFSFGNFYKTMEFVNALAFIANAQGHHPDLTVGYDYCHVTFSTHAIDGLSENDFICAARVDALFR